MDLELHRIFVKVAQQNSFSRAAEILKLPKSTVSKAIVRLEKDAGTKLILRTTRNLTLTPSGREFFEASLGPITALEEAQKALNGQDSRLTGLIRLTAPEDLGSLVIAPAISDLVKAHSGLSFEFQFTDERIDLVRDGFDLAVRIGRVDESSFKVRKVGRLSMVLVAAPEYRKAQQVIHPRDLTHQNCLSFSNGSIFDRWELHAGREKFQVPMKPRASSNQMTSLVKMAVAGAGIALVPEFLCREELEKGSLLRILPEWGSQTFPVSIITPMAPSSSARLKTTTDYLSEAIAQTLA